MVEVSQYLSVFVEECAEHLQSLTQALLELESAPENEEALNTIFRAVHTLKGASMTMGFNKMSVLTSAMEDILGGLRDKELKGTPEIVSLLFGALDLLEALAHGIGSGREEDVEIMGVTQQMRRFTTREETGSPGQMEKRQELQLRYTPQEEETIVRTVADGATLWHVSVALTPDCLLKGARAFMVLRELKPLGQVVRSIPEARDLEDENFEDSFIVGLLSRESPDRIAAAVKQVTDVARVGVDRWTVEKIQVERRVREVAEMAPADAGMTIGFRTAPAGQTVRVDIRKLDDLMNLVAELVNHRSRLEQIGSALHSRELDETLELIGRLTMDLQNRVLKVRMVPVENVFRRFPRLIRDLCKEMGKQAALVIHGGETELDRTVIDEIGDPLMHILRNCLDHGIEIPADRAAKGKPPTGTILLEARQESNSVAIRISDDGQGIDLARVGAKAIELDLVRTEQLEEMEPAEVAQLVFAPGLSTADRITELSGRGVGMDVVKAKIDSLRGTVTVETAPDRGTTVVIRLPLTLAIIQALMVELGQDVYLIPSTSIDSAISVLKKDIKKIRNQEVTMVRGEILPLIRLQTALGVGKARNDEADELDVVVIRQGDRRLGYIVDGLLRQQDVVLKPLGGVLSGLHGVAGATILGNGRVALILDVRSVA